MQRDDGTRPTLGNHEESFAGCSLQAASVDPTSCRWGDSFVERAVAPTRDHDVSDNTQHSALSLFPSSCLPEPSEVMAEKTIRFAEVIATDMESIPPDSSREIPLASSQQGEVSTMPNSSADDSACDTSKIMGDEDRIIRQHLYDAVSRAAVRDALGWTARKVLQLFHKRVDEEEDDRVGGGDLWGNNPIGDQLQIKDIAKGMFVNDENKGSKDGAAVGVLNPEVLSL